MRRYLRKLAEMIAPTAYRRLRRLSVLDDESLSGADILLRYEEQIHDLQAQVNEMRRENRRVVELYDAVFERLQRDNPLRERV